MTVENSERWPGLEDISRRGRELEAVAGPSLVRSPDGKWVPSPDPRWRALFNEGKKLADQWETRWQELAREGKELADIY